MNTNKATLFFSLGATENVLRDTLRGMVERNILFNKVIIIGNTPFFKRTDGKEGLSETIRSILSEFPQFETEILDTGLDDTYTEAENQLFFEKVVLKFEQEKLLTNTIYVSIAGGRKTMSALLLAAAYIAGVQQIFHTLVTQEALDNERLYKIIVPLEAINIVPVPILQLDKLLSHILTDIDKENKFNSSVFRLIDQLKTKDAFEQLNNYIREQSRMRALLEVYQREKQENKRMTDVTEMIVGNILKDKLMHTPLIKKRVKDFDSFFKKIIEKEKKGEVVSQPFERISDLMGLRVVFYNTLDMQDAIKKLQASDDFINANSKKGKVLFADDRTKEYGYKATHFDVKINPEKRIELPEYIGLKDRMCEIQFTTILAHAWAEVHHEIYKGKEMPGNAEKTAEFKTAADELERIENYINSLCIKYFKQPSLINK